MKHDKLWVLVLFALLLAACGGGSTLGAPRSAASGHGGTPAGEAQASSAPMADGMPAPAPAEAAASPSAGPRDEAFNRGGEAEQPASERPGLGTSWGETRGSHVSTAPFFRMNPDNPDKVATLFYNNAAGVRAMARRSGSSDAGDGAVSIAGGALGVRLLDGSGRPLRGVHAGGRTYAIGEAGDRYIIQIRNNTRNRIEAVATVDGLDVIDGQPGSFEKRGYVLAPFGSVEIEGFRRSMDEVAAFRFGSVSSSYAAKTGTDRNVGVIGVAFFLEEGSRFPWTDDEVRRRHDADPFPGRFASPPPDSF